MRRPVIASALAAVSLLGGFLVASGCRDNLQDKVTNECVNEEVFKASVSPFLERRCGTLDCHGGIARPMRLYGKFGLRLSAANFAGGADTTADELDANYASVCNVDAEKMQAVKDQTGSPEQHLLFTKASGAEKHKGGQVIGEDDDEPGHSCILNWLRDGDAEAIDKKCKEAVANLSR